MRGQRRRKRKIKEESWEIDEEEQKSAEQEDWEKELEEEAG